MPELLPYKGKVYLWHYLPSIPAAVVAAVLFLIIAILQTWSFHRTKARFCSCFVIGSYCKSYHLVFILNTARSLSSLARISYMIKNHSLTRITVEVIGYIFRIYAYYKTNAVSFIPPSPFFFVSDIPILRHKQAYNLTHAPSSSRRTSSKESSSSSPRRYSQRASTWHSPASSHPSTLLITPRFRSNTSQRPSSSATGYRSWYKEILHPSHSVLKPRK